MNTKSPGKTDSGDPSVEGLAGAGGSSSGSGLADGTVLCGGVVPPPPPQQPNPITIDRDWLVRIASLHTDRGITVIPLCAPIGADACSVPWHDDPDCRGADSRCRGKRPALWQWTDATTWTPHQLIDIWCRARTLPTVNAGIVLGDYLAAVEADSPEADAEAVALIGRIAAPRRAARPGRGRAWLFRLDEPHHGRRGAGRSKCIDIKTGNAILVFEGVHKSGCSIALDVDPMTIPTPMAPERILGMMRERNTTPQHTVPSSTPHPHPAPPAFTSNGSSATSTTITQTPQQLNPVLIQRLPSTVFRYLSGYQERPGSNRSRPRFF